MNMASFFKLVLDTLAPQEVSLLINNGVTLTASHLVTLKISTKDAVTTGYQMKIWGGIEDVALEADATWQTYTSSLQVTLSPSDGIKTIYVKVRDDVLNESSVASATIEVNTAVPVVTLISGPDITRVSYNAPKDVVNFSWRADVDIVEWKVCVVATEADAHNVGSIIPITNGSLNMSGLELAANTSIASVLKAKDIAVASDGDGEKIIKVFAKTASGIWSA